MKMTLVQGDITAQRVDAVVNAANSSLLGGGGVDGAIHRRGGPAILAACRDLRASRYSRGLPTGQAVATVAGDLPARWVIHTVGPVFSTGEDRSRLLASCYRESLRVADELGAVSVAFPAISTGVYGWPLDDAARIAIGTVRATPTRVTDLRFVLFTPDSHTIFEKALTAAGPTNDEISATLAAQPGELWEELFALADRLTAADLQTPWAGGRKLESGAVQAPYPVYADTVRAIMSLLDRLNVAVVFDWTSWYRSDRYPGGRGLADAPVAEAARLTTVLVRGERFSEGTIAENLKDGTMRALLDRLRRWYLEERLAG